LARMLEALAEGADWTPLSPELVVAQPHIG
jgi:hypothetical protein